MKIAILLLLFAVPAMANSMDDLISPGSSSLEKSNHSIYSLDTRGPGSLGQTGNSMDNLCRGSGSL